MMMKTVATFLLVFLSAISSADLPSNYQSLAGKEKRSLLWSRIESSHYLNDDLPQPDIDSMLSQMLSFMVGDARLDSLKSTLTHAGDELPDNKSGKFIHPYGTVLKVKYVPAKPNPKLGVLGATEVPGLLRMSLAGPYLPGLSAFIPGVAVKLFLGNGKNGTPYPSVNLMAMQRLEGQGDDTFFFRHDFTTAIPLPQVPDFPLSPVDWVKASTHGIRGIAHLGIKTKADLNTYLFLKHFQRKFERATGGRPANVLPMEHLLGSFPDGTRNQSAAGVYKIVLKPTEAVKKAYSASRKTDYRLKIADIPEGTPLYDFYYYETSTSPGEKVGSLLSDSIALASEYGDDILFFQHHYPLVRR